MKELNVSLAERLIIPAAVTFLFALMSGGFMFGVGGATRRMKILLRCSIVFIAGATYSIAWQDKLADMFGWDDAWMGATVLSALVSIWLGRRWFGGWPR